MLRGLKSFRENLTKGIGVLQKNDPLEFSPLLKNLYDSGIFQIQKLLDFNLSYLLDKSLEFQPDLIQDKLQSQTNSVIRKSQKQPHKLPVPRSNISRPSTTANQITTTDELRIVDQDLSDADEVNICEDNKNQL